MPPLGRVYSSGPGRVVFVPSPTFASHALNSPEMARSLNQVGQVAKREAVRLVPKRTENLADSIDYAVGVEGGRLVLRLFARDFKAWWIEAGTARAGLAGDPRPYLRPALQAAAPGASWTATA